jgi:uncharacterized protein (DUF433 family)
MPVVSLDYIEVDDRGVARIAGTRSKVRHIAVDTMNGLSPQQIHEAYPHLSLAQIHAALAYYYDHKDQIDAEIEVGARFADEMRAKHPNRYTREELVAKWQEKFPGRPLPGEDESEPA